MPNRKTLTRALFIAWFGFSLLGYTQPAFSGCDVFLAPSSEQTEIWTDQARHLISQRAEAFDRDEGATEVFRTLKNKIRSSENPAVVKIRNVFEREQYDFAIAVPADVRESVMKDGFENHHSTGTSNGSPGSAGRKRAEALLLGQKKNAYETLDHHVMPKYGFLKPSPQSGLDFRYKPLSQYGEDTWVFKKDALKDRVTYSFGDSLEHGIRPQGHWDEKLLPWAEHEFLIPYLLDETTPHAPFSDIPYGTNQRFRPDLEKYLKNDRRPRNQKGAELFPEVRYSAGGRYIEMQFFGPITLDHVEAFEFSTTPPSGDFLQELLRRKIEIRKVTGNKALPWSP